MKTKINYLLTLILGLITLVSCNEKQVEYSGDVEASIYYYDSLHKDTILVQATLYKYTQDREIEGASIPVTRLSNKEISITYYVGKLDYTNRYLKTSVSYIDTKGDYITVGDEMNTTMLIGKNSYSCLSIFYKPLNEK